MTALPVHPLHPFMTLSPLHTADVELNAAAPAAVPGAIGLDSAEPAAPDATAVRLSRGIARGDHAALDEFYRAWFDRAFAAARALSRRDEAFCLDVVQEAMLRVIKSLPPLSGAAALEAWMHTAIRSSTIDALRAEARRVAREIRAAGMKRARPIAQRAGQRASHAEEHEINTLLATLAELDPVSQDLLRLRFERDKSLEATAHAKGITAAAAHGKIRRILAWMKERMEP